LNSCKIEQMPKLTSSIYSVPIIFVNVKIDAELFLYFLQIFSDQWFIILYLKKKKKNGYD